MPDRLYAPEDLHPMIIKGIEQERICKENKDREDFLAL
jgi:hypothetical protein